MKTIIFFSLRKMAENITEEEIIFLKKRRMDLKNEEEKMQKEKKLKSEKKIKYQELYNNYVGVSNDFYKFKEDYEKKSKQMQKELRNLKEELCKNCVHYQPNQDKISTYDGMSFECPGCETFIDSNNYKIIDKRLVFLNKNVPLKTWNPEKFDSDSESEI